MKQIRKLINLGYEYNEKEYLMPEYCFCGTVGANIIEYKNEEGNHNVTLCNNCLKEFKKIKLMDLRLNKLNRIIK